MFSTNKRHRTKPLRFVEPIRMQQKANENQLESSKRRTRTNQNVAKANESQSVSVNAVKRGVKGKSPHVDPLRVLLRLSVAADFVWMAVRRPCPPASAGMCVCACVCLKANINTRRAQIHNVLAMACMQRYNLLVHTHTHTHTLVNRQQEFIYDCLNGVFDACLHTPGVAVSSS